MIIPADASGIARAAALLAAGELVAFPTETVYGLGADARNRDAVLAIFRVKGRPADHPVIVHLADASAMDAWCARVPAAARQLASAFWPGPLTLIVPRAPHVDDSVTGGQDSVGLRVPSHPVAQALLRAFGHGVAAPSANRFGRISPTTAAHVADDLGDDVRLILDGGACDVGIESTIVAVLDDGPTLLRPGIIGIEALASVLGRAPRLGGFAASARADATPVPRASGTLASHYAPRAPARLVHAEELVGQAAHDPAVAVLARSVARPAAFAGAWIDAPRDHAGYAHALYSNLRDLDRAGVRAILIERIPDDPQWFAVRDRLQRATHPGADDDDID